uniref:MADS-box domain-containing protein n=1 Tax=Lactuca sativa TaxID=4236 RepID=A0A9R1XQ66_LACSA|nr:hypothetical protein LSAT_V11C200090960 [Lactuca sativa]
MHRPSKGRKKIEMKRINNMSSLLVAFSKSHSGLFKMASEMCTLCGVEMEIIVFSPTKTVFLFGHPSVQTIIDRYLKQNLPPNRYLKQNLPPSARTSQLEQRYCNTKTQELNLQLTNLLAQLEAEKKTSEELNMIRKARQESFWWDSPIENLGVEQLEKLKVMMLNLKNNSINQAEKIVMAEAANLTEVLCMCGSTWLGGIGPSV